MTGKCCGMRVVAGSNTATLKITTLDWNTTKQRPMLATHLYDQEPDRCTHKPQQWHVFALPLYWLQQSPLFSHLGQSL
jgi:hypothetical protein